MKRMIFATGNENKMKEIREILGALPLEILSMKEAGVSADIVEDGKTFEENALIKLLRRFRRPVPVHGAGQIP